MADITIPRRAGGGTDWSNILGAAGSIGGGIVGSILPGIGTTIGATAGGALGRFAGGAVNQQNAPKGGPQPLAVNQNPIARRYAAAMEGVA